METVAAPINQPSRSVIVKKGKEMILDTKGSCFLCLEETEKMTELSFRDICRHLNINPGSIILKSRQDNVFTDEEYEQIMASSLQAAAGEKCNFSVMLCPTCASLIKNLSELISKVEIMKMLISDKVRVVHEILSRSEQESHRFFWENLKDKMISDCESLVEVRLVENLRQQTKDKCSARIQRDALSSVPKVLLDPLEAKPDSDLCEIPSALKLEPIVELYETDDDPKMLSFPITSSEYISEIETPKKANLSSTNNSSTRSSLSTLRHNSTENPNSEVSNSSASSMLTLDIFSKHFKVFESRNSSVPQGRYQCHFCTYLAIGSNSINVSKHLANIHPERIFVSAKLPNVSDTKFRQFCIDLLAAVKTGAVKIFKTAFAKNGKLSCMLCNAELYNDYEVSYHMISEHYAPLQEKLVSLQQGQVSLDAIGMELVREATAGTQENEPIKLISQQSEIIYIAASDSQQNQQPCNTNDGNNSTSAVSIPEADSIIALASSSTNTISPYQKGKIKSSKSIPSSKQWIFDIISKNCDRMQSPTNKYDVRFTCLLCHSECSDSKIRNHFVNNHPDMFFRDSRLPHVTEDEAFRFHCRNLLLLETSQAVRINAPSKRDGGGKKKRLALLCSYCHQKYWESQDFKKHLVVEHHYILKDKLASLQENGLSSEDEARIRGTPKVITADQLPMPLGGARSTMKRRYTKLFACAGPQGGCGQQFTCKSALERHASVHCPYNRTERLISKAQAQTAAVVPSKSGKTGPSTTLVREDDDSDFPSCKTRKVEVDCSITNGQPDSDSSENEHVERDFIMEEVTHEDGGDIWDPSWMPDCALDQLNDDIDEMSPMNENPLEESCIGSVADQINISHDIIDIKVEEGSMVPNGYNMT